MKITGVIMMWVSGFLLGFALTSTVYKDRIIDRGYGEYCSVSGEFAFKGECDQ